MWKNGVWVDLKPFFCCGALSIPTVFDESLTSYEQMCKLKEIFNAVINDVNILKDLSDSMGAEIGEIKKQIEEIINADYSFIKGLIADAIKNVWFGLTNAGYFVAYIPESWDDITFRTTGLDITVPLVPEYGHLVLQY